LIVQLKHVDNNAAFWMVGGHSGTIRTYAAYLIEKIHVYGELKRDPVRTGVQGRDGYLKSLSLSKGLLHHVAALQKQIAALLSCKVK
jgi:hypothetical protein